MDHTEEEMRKTQRITALGLTCTILGFLLIGITTMISHFGKNKGENVEILAPPFTMDEMRVIDLFGEYGVERCITLDPGWYLCYIKDDWAIVRMCHIKQLAYLDPTGYVRERSIRPLYVKQRVSLKFLAYRRKPLLVGPDIEGFVPPHIGIVAVPNPEYSTPGFLEMDEEECREVLDGLFFESSLDEEFLEPEEV